MPYVKFSRDKRGYEQIALVHSGGRDHDSRPRTLYVFRTPPGVRVGREPFDSDTRRLLEIRYPDISFDWNSIAAAQAPPPEEPWRERRRLKRAAKEFALHDETDGAEDVPDDKPDQQAAGEMQSGETAARPAGRRRRRGRRRHQPAAGSDAPAVQTDEQSTAEADRTSES